MQNVSKKLAGITFLLLLPVLAGPLAAQVRVRLPNGTGDATLDSSAGLAPVPPGSFNAGVTLGQPSFDPYAPAPATGGFGSVFGTTPPPTQPPSVFGGTPTFGSPPPVAPTFGGSPTLGGTAAPPALFPNGFCGPNGCVGPDGNVVGTPLRFIQGPRFKHAWLEGGDGREMDINESDISVVLTYPNFFFSTQPLYIAPSFAFDLWDNPEGSTFPAGADLPAQAYAAFLDSYWKSDPSRFFGAEVGARVGVWSDFQTMNTDSIRIQGLGLGRVKFTPTLTLRAGVMYVDRARIKLIPAGGILWEPNPQTRYDIFFPQPKLSNYLTTLGNQDVWWYIGGEYGGDSWTIERAIDGGSDRVDLNDIRAYLGLEWGAPELFREGRRLGFVEVGWVTGREGEYVRRPEDNFTLRDTFMLRAGIGY